MILQLFVFFGKLSIGEVLMGLSGVKEIAHRLGPLRSPQLTRELVFDLTLELVKERHKLFNLSLQV